MTAQAVSERVKNARRAFKRAPATSDIDRALLRSGRLLARYTHGLGDNAEGLRDRQAINQLAAEYLDRCYQHRQHRGQQ